MGRTHEASPVQQWLVAETKARQALVAYGAGVTRSAYRSAGGSPAGAADELAEADVWRLLVEVLGCLEEDLPYVILGLHMAPTITARLRVLEDERSEILRFGSGPKMDGSCGLVGAGSLQTHVAGNGGAVGTNCVSINRVSGSMLLSDAPESQTFVGRSVGTAANGSSPTPTRFPTGSAAASRMCA